MNSTEENNIRQKKIYLIFAESMLVLISIMAYVVMEIVDLQQVTWNLWRMVINIVPFYILGRVIFLFSKSVKISTLVVLGSSFLYSVASYYVWTFRGQPILPWDLQAFSTATNVAASYTYTLTKYIVYGFLICVVGIVCSFFKKKEKPLRVSWKYVVMELVLVVSLSCYYYSQVYPTLTGNLWDMKPSFVEQGMLGGFLGHVQYCLVNEPEAYDAIDVKCSIEAADLIEHNGIEVENIIVIMNESFADFRVINNEIISDEYMPFIDSLTENTIKGNLYVPVFGGYTCDSEFEVLMGASTAYTTMLPYQTTMNKPTDSLVTYLADRGFYTTSLHPYGKKNWNRETVYSNIGFQEYTAIEDMTSENMRYVRWCISDESDYEELIKQYEEHNDNKFFMFNVTMQNHGGYEEEYDNFKKTVDLSSYGEFVQAENYLSMLKESDKAFQQLIEYFSEVEEPTLICLFGDHFPSVGDEFYSLLYGRDITSLTAEEYQRMYITPVVLWANYDIEENTIDKISSNYLGLEILKAANIDLEGYYSLLNEVYEQYPVLSQNGTIDKDGTWWHTTDLLQDEFILQQQYIQYYRVYE